MSYQYSDDQESPRMTPAVQWIIALNVMIYFVQVTMFGPALEHWLGFEIGGLTTSLPLLRRIYVEPGFNEEPGRASMRAATSMKPSDGH